MAFVVEVGSCIQNETVRQCFVVVIQSVISRDDILKQADKVLSDLGSSRAILEIQYENEVCCNGWFLFGNITPKLHLQTSFIKH